MYNDPLGNTYKAPWQNPPLQFWEPLGLGSGLAGPMDNGWQNEGAFDDNGAFSSDNGQARVAFWAPAVLSGGDLQVKGIYHAGDGTSADPHTGISNDALNGLLNGTGTVTIGSDHWQSVVVNNSFTDDSGTAIVGMTYMTDGTLGNANQEGDPNSPALIFGATETSQNGYRVERDDGWLGDKFEFRTYAKTTVKGHEGLFNINYNTYIDQYGRPFTSSDLNANEGFLHLRLLSSTGVSADVGIDGVFSLSGGLVMGFY